MSLYSKKCLQEISAHVNLLDLLFLKKIECHGMISISSFDCPFCSEENCLLVDEKHYYCKNCGAKGDCLTFLMATELMPFSEAIPYLAKFFKCGHALDMEDEKSEVSTDKQIIDDLRKRVRMLENMNALLKLKNECIKDTK